MRFVSSRSTLVGCSMVLVATSDRFVATRALSDISISRTVATSSSRFIHHQRAACAGTRRPLSTRTTLRGPASQQPSDDLAPILTGCVNRSRKENTRKPGNSFPLVREKQNVPYIMRHFSQPRWSTLLALVAIASLAWLLPVRTVSALSDGPTVLVSGLMESGLGASPAMDMVQAAASGGMRTTVATSGSSSIYTSAVSLQNQLRLAGRMVYAAFLGAVVGKERCGRREHQQHSPAGSVRTMALVSLGAATFTLCSMYGFGGVGASRYDPSRMAANVSTGVGFLGAGVITTSNQQQGPPQHRGITNPCTAIHGLTTAAAIWLSAAVGVGCGVGLCVISTTAALLTIAVLRIGEQSSIYETKRKLTEQHVTAQRAYEDQQILRELRRASAGQQNSMSPSSSFLKEIEESVVFHKSLGEPIKSNRSDSHGSAAP